MCCRCFSYLVSKRILVTFTLQMYGGELNRASRHVKVSWLREGDYYWT